MEFTMENESIFLERIKEKRQFNQSFEHFFNCFKNKLTEFNPINKSFNIEEYFGKGIGQIGTIKRLINDNKIKENWLNNERAKRDFKGIYVFVHDDTPIYVGISKGIIGRISQHIKGNTHNHATLAFSLALVMYEINNNQKYTGSRDDLDFKDNVEPMKQFLMKQKIAFFPIEDNEELYLFEIYVAMELKTRFNIFETH
jgi:predicted GIY-YIG superfamily endonuclease